MADFGSSREPHNACHHTGIDPVISYRLWRRSQAGAREARRPTLQPRVGDRVGLCRERGVDRLLKPSRVGSSVQSRR